MKRSQALALKIAAIVLSTLAALLVIAEILLSPAVATRLVNKYAPQFIDADLKFGKAGISLFRNFPNVSVRLEDAVLTYPHERFAALEDDSRSVLMSSGRAEDVDTLASFGRFTGAIRPFSLLAGTVNVRRVELLSPRIFAKNYNDSTANWDIFGSSSEEQDTSSLNLRIKVSRLRLADGVRVVYCSPKDSLFAALNLSEMALKGHVELSDLARSRGDFRVRDLSVAGRLKSDTLVFSLSSMDLAGSRKNFSLDLSATAWAALRGYGRVRVPISLEAKGAYPKDSIPSVNLRKLKSEVAGIPLEGRAEARMHHDRYYVDADLAMSPVDVGELLSEYGPVFWREAGKVESNARLSLKASAKGYYVPATGEYPLIDASLTIPDSHLRYAGVEQALHLLLEARAAGGGKTPVNVRTDCLDVHTDGLELKADADVSDLLGGDPDIRLDASLSADIARALGILPEDAGVTGRGNLEGNLSAKALLSHLNVNSIGKASVEGHLASDCLVIGMPSDSLLADVDNLSIGLGICSNKYDPSMSPDDRVLMVTMSADTLNAEYKGMYVRAGEVRLDAQNSADIIADSEFSMTNVRPFCGFNSFRTIRLKDADSTVISVRGLKDEFYMRPKGDNPQIPELHASSDISRAMLRSSTNRLMVKDLKASLTAAMNTYERKARMQKLRDSLSRVYPDIPKDSVVRYAWRQKKSSRPLVLPEWLQEEDFKAGDLNLKLSGTLAKYFNEWDLEGSFSVGRASLMTPYLPLRNSISKASASFTSNKVDIRNITARSGSSDLSMSGTIGNLRKALGGRGPLTLDLRVTSEGLNANELLSALDAGSKVTTGDIAAVSSLDDDDFEKSLAMQVPADSIVAPSLIIVPANVIANIYLDAKQIQYSKLDFDWLQAEIAMKERCLQLTNLVAMSNMGNVYCEAFYSTRTKQNIKAGINMDLEDITAEKVIELVPAVDSLMPLLKSFTGLMNCSVAATTSLDEDMNIIFPTLKGVVRINGNDLMVDGLGDLSRITRLLMFKNKNQLFVDEMNVDALIADNQVEIFPFVLDVDRYKLALSGIQNLDTSFKYHVSVMKWPLLFKFGIDLAGDFDKFKFHIGKAKYRKAKTMPVFNAMIDDSKANLRDIIHNVFSKSVEKAVEEYNVQQRFAQYKDSLDYVPAVEQPLDTLDGKDSRIFANLGAVAEVVDLENVDLERLDSVQVAKLDSLGVSADDLREMLKDQ